MEAQIERAAERIQQAQYRAAVEQRAEHREVARVQPAASADEPPRPLSDEEQAQVRAALDSPAQCSTRKLVRDAATGLYLPRPRKNCR